MAKLTHFKCDSCTKIFPIEQRKIVKTVYTIFDRDSEREFGGCHYHIQLCKKCRDKK